MHPVQSLDDAIYTGHVNCTHNNIVTMLVTVIDPYAYHINR